jgi:hypothetical protein
VTVAHGASFDPIEDIGASPKVTRHFGSLRHALSRLKRIKELCVAGVSSKLSVSPPGCGDPNRLGLWQNTTRASGSAKRPGSLFRQLAGKLCMPPGSTQTSCTLEVGRTVSGNDEKGCRLQRKALRAQTLPPTAN